MQGVSGKIVSIWSVIYLKCRVCTIIFWDKTNFVVQQTIVNTAYMFATQRCPHLWYRIVDRNVILPLEPKIVGGGLISGFDFERM